MIGTILKGGFVTLGMILLAAALYLFWQNRSSEKVAQTFLTVFILGMGGAIGSILLTLKEETKSTRFPVVYIVDRKTGRPEAYASGSYAWVVFGSKRPDVLQSLQISEKQLERLYRDFTVYKIIDDLFAVYGNHWHRRLIDLKGPAVSQTVYDDLPQSAPGTKLRWEDVRKMLSHNVFMGGKRDVPEVEETQLPPGTTLTVRAADDGATVRAINRFFDYELTLSFNSWTYSLGDYAKLIDKPSGDLAVLMFAVTIEAKFNQYRMGHPVMPSYRDWVDTTTEVLERHYSWYRQWEEEKSGI
jgi:hypothetical protein